MQLTVQHLGLCQILPMFADGRASYPKGIEVDGTSVNQYDISTKQSLQF